MTNEMLYAILCWDEESLKWNVEFYTFSYDNYMKEKDKYPNDTHMISVRALQYHELMEKIRGLKLTGKKS